jgi:hypothetical protein
MSFDSKRRPPNAPFPSSRKFYDVTLSPLATNFQRVSGRRTSCDTPARQSTSDSSAIALHVLSEVLPGHHLQVTVAVVKAR